MFLVTFKDAIWKIIIEPKAMQKQPTTKRKGQYQEKQDSKYGKTIFKPQAKMFSLQPEKIPNVRLIFRKESLDN